MELLVVLAIMGIIAGIVIANVSFQNPCSRLDGNARDLFGAINLAKTNAPVDEEYILIITPDARKFFLIRDAGGEIKDNLSAFDPDNPEAILGDGDELIYPTSSFSPGNLGDGVYFSVHPTVNEALPFPFSSYNPSQACNFCDSSLGAIVFYTDGSIEFRPNNPDVGIVLMSVDSSHECAPGADTYAVVISRYTGYTRLYHHLYLLPSGPGEWR